VKTKRVSGVDLPSSVFAFVGNQDETDSWQVPLFVRGDTGKTANLIKNAIQRFAEMKHIPDELRVQVWQRIVGAALAHGIECDAKFAAKPESRPEVHAEVKAVELSKTEPVMTDQELAAVIANADLKSDLLLRSLGLE
jgi:hypothetical protein